jgi:hypothetical protein
MKYRKLRIAWSVACGVSAVLLVMLWARSYRYWDQLYTPICLEAYTSADWEGRIITIESATERKVASWSAGGGVWQWHISVPLRGRASDVAGPYLSPTNDAPPIGWIGFAFYKRFGLHPAICVPIWFLVIFAATLGSLPWIAYAKRFSLRALLIGMTVVAVALGAVIYATR